MTDEITATKAELANDLISVIKMNKELIDSSREAQRKIDGLTRNVIMLTESSAFQKGRAKELRIQLNVAKQKIKGLEDKK